MEENPQIFCTGLPLLCSLFWYKCKQPMLALQGASLKNNVFASTPKDEVEHSVCKRDYVKQKVRVDKLFFMLVFLICTFGFYPHL